MNVLSTSNIYVIVALRYVMEKRIAEIVRIKINKLNFIYLQNDLLQMPPLENILLKRWKVSLE